MIAAILAAALTVISYPATVVRDLDGDTIRVSVAQWPAPFDPIDVRIADIDTPESHRQNAKSACELKLGLAAAAYAQTLIHPGDAVVVAWRPGAHEKFGRLLASVTLADGSDFAARMVGARMARPYTAANLHKGPWCAKGKPIPLNP